MNVSEAYLKIKEIRIMCDNFPKDVCENNDFYIRILELVGLILSCASCLAALLIYFNYRCLRNYRTKIHVHLFIASFMHIVFRLIKYYIPHNTNSIVRNFLNASLEYSRTTTITWVFIEGLYLNNLVAISFHKPWKYMTCYYVAGWCLPAVQIIIWLWSMLANNLNDFDWIFYSFLNDYMYYLEGPRIILIIVNFCFLLNVVRIIIKKLRDEQTTEIQQVRKAVKAALCLCPLLGIQSLFHWIPYIYDQPWKYEVRMYTVYFFDRFQIFFVALIYCFLNKEVQNVVGKSFRLKMNGGPRFSKVSSTGRSKMRLLVAMVHFKNNKLIEIARGSKISGITSEDTNESIDIE